MTTNIDTFRDNLINLIKAHDFRKTDYVENEYGETQEIMNKLYEDQVARLADEMIEVLTETVTEEGANKKDFAINIYIDPNKL